MLAHISDLDDVNFELEDQSKQANKERRSSMRGKKKADKRAAAWQNKASEKQGMENALNDQFVELMFVNTKHKGIIAHYRSSQDSINIINKEMHKVRMKVKRGGGARWEVWFLLLCCKLLVSVVDPSTIPKNIMTMYETMYGDHPR